MRAVHHEEVDWGDWYGAVDARFPACESEASHEFGRYRTRDGRPARVHMVRDWNLVTCRFCLAKHGRAFVRRVAKTNPTLSMRVAKARQETA